MEIFKIWAIVGFLFLFIEMATPTMFFLNLAAAAFFAGVAAYFWPENLWVQAWVFILIAAILLAALRPFLLKNAEKNEEKTGIEGKYIGHTAQVLDTIGAEGTDGIGNIKIYGEVWQAKSIDDKLIEPPAMVKIVKNESLIMFVKEVI